MSEESDRRVILSEWRTVLISQTVYPMMYKIEYPRQQRLDGINTDVIQFSVPFGHRVMRVWQEQVRPLEKINQSFDLDQRWYVVREWTEAEL